jgi:hypothetical protein
MRREVRGDLRHAHRRLDGRSGAGSTLRPRAAGPLLDEADELVLLGDVFDLLFSSVEHAFEQADPFFELLAETMAGGTARTAELDPKLPVHAA